MLIDWSPLRRCLAACRAERCTLPFWWRDDDAIEPTPALDRLDALAATLDIPVHLAVIPDPARQSLAARVAASGRFVQRALPLFVPPWNRIDPAYYQVLADAGYGAVSTFAPRPSA